MTAVAVPPSFAPDTRSEALGRCPNWRLGSSCKKRDCPVCGVRWARDWRRAMEINLEAHEGQLLLITLTAPGADRLPWDLGHCSHRPDRECSGKLGCRVQQRAAREWNDVAPWKWARLRNAARMATERTVGVKPRILERVWEPQKRGVAHLHVVLGYGRRERLAARVFLVHLARLAREYDFGFPQPSPRPRMLAEVGLGSLDELGVVELEDGRRVVDGELARRQLVGLARRLLVKPKTGREAARYLASYLTGRSRKKHSIRENVAAALEIRPLDGGPPIKHPVMPRSLIWLTPRLTTRTFVTMRTLRRARHLYAFARGLCPPPVWRSMAEAAKVALVCRLVFARRRSGDDPDPDSLLRYADQLERELGRSWRARLYDWNYFTGLEVSPLGEQVNAFWLDVAGVGAAA